MRALGCVVVMAASATQVSSTPTTAENMNGDEYLLQATPHGEAALTNWSTKFKDYPGGVEFFEVYAGPITTTYGEVFWTGLPPAPIPADVAKRFDGKVMAVVGFEADQVRKTPDGDVSVPINVAYNHHYGATLVGSGSAMKKVKTSTLVKEGDHRAFHPSPTPGYTDIAVEHTPSASGAPTSLQFGYSNGGEFRKTYHALAPPFAQLIESPNHVSCGPMQIDTWNREKMNVTGSAFVAGPAPKLALAPLTGVDAIYSGLLECPLTTRIRKQITGGGFNDTFITQLDTCTHVVTSAEECFTTAAKEIGIDGADTITTGTGSSAILPAGCSIKINRTGAHLFFNTGASNVGCGDGRVLAIAGHAVSPHVNLSLSLGGAGAGAANITMVGPSDVWFGVGFDTQFMSNSPYAITVDGSTGVVTERVLGNHEAGIVLNTSVAVVSNTVVDGVRTLILTRPLKGLTPHHHDFDSKKMSLNFIAAIGASPHFSYHKTKTTATIALWPSAYTSGSTDPTVKGGKFGFFAGKPASAELRNNFAGEVGYTIVAAEDLSVTALGRSNNGETALKAGAAVTIWDAKTKAVVARSVVAPTTATVESGYSYVDLAQPASLKKGQAYYVTMACSAGMPDKWVDTNANAGSIVWSGLATLGDGIYSPTVGSYPSINPSNGNGNPLAHGRWAGIATFKVAVAPHVAPPVVGTPATCVCSLPALPFGQGQGTLKYLPTGEVIGFPLRCNLGDADFSVMKNKNPTCDIRTYVGGLSTCHHGWHLLDAEQELPWQDQPITYYIKYRLYYQEYVPSKPASATNSTANEARGSTVETEKAKQKVEHAVTTRTSPPHGPPAPAWQGGSHVQVFDNTWSIAGATGEYDVPQCAAGTPTEQCTHEISGTIVPDGPNYHFVAAHYHCHAPTCISMEIWNNRTGELLCKEVPYHGAASAATQSDRFDEPGYIAQRICLWGLHPPFEYPPLVTGERLWVKAVTNSTYGHHGEMALPQMLLAQLPPRNASTVH